MGELQLAIKFTNLSLANKICLCGHPLLPKMHLHPSTINQVDNLRYQTTNIVAVRLGRAEPPLRTEVVEYMYRLRHPPYMDTKLSWAEVVHPDELDKELTQSLHLGPMMLFE
ncbi:C2 domain-containing family [Olea europaea subsp. europaea]|uniref:C2 domain-containing family n=1 Tax=Olea europaea subsp. europaea TaxID=158383 RepID=A0A8S0VMP3_OLEEU|nr:C2 domain-containing family [Olea europaea subsp. europaea]